MLTFRAIAGQMRFGIAAAAFIVLGTALYTWIWWPLFGVWSWPELVLGSLFVTVLSMAGIEMIARQPNPYARLYPLYNMRDLPETGKLESGGSGWLVQSVPLVATALVLIGIFLMFCGRYVTGLTLRNPT